MVTGEPDLAALQSEFSAYSAETDLVKVALSGRLPGDLYDTRGEWLEALRKNAIYLEDDFSGLIKEIRAADIEREFTQGSFPFRLLSGLAGEDGDPESLQIAWDLVKEAKA
jgi:hypothetical protein